MTGASGVWQEAESRQLLTYTRAITFRPKQFLTFKEPAKLTTDSRSGSREFRLNLMGGRGLAYKLEGSTDFSNWTTMGFLTNETGIVSWTNHPANSDSVRIFRANEL